MPKYRRLKDVEKELGNLELVIPPLVNKGGQKFAAEKLEFSQPTISGWLKDNGYISRTIWQKDATPQEKADIEAVAVRVNARLIAQGLPTLEEEEDS